MDNNLREIRFENRAMPETQIALRKTPDGGLRIDYQDEYGPASLEFDASDMRTIRELLE